MLMLLFFCALSVGAPAPPLDPIAQAPSFKEEAVRLLLSNVSVFQPQQRAPITASTQPFVRWDASMPVTGGLWVEQGPGKITGDGVKILENPFVDFGYRGAVHVVLPHPSDANVLYVGSVNGGVWKTTNALSAPEEVHWQPLTDHQISSSISAMCIDPADPNRIVAGFGQVSAKSLQGSSQFIILSEDGGETWRQPHTLGRFPAYGGVVEHVVGCAVRGSRIVVALRGRQVVTSDDGGLTWDVNLRLSQIINLMIEDPSNTNVLYLGTLGAVLKSVDAGHNWAVIQSIPDETRAVFLALSKDGSRLYIAHGPATGTEEDFAFIGYIDEGDGLLVEMDIPGSGSAQPPSWWFNTINPLAVDPGDKNVVYLSAEAIPAVLKGLVGCPVGNEGLNFKGDTNLPRGYGEDSLSTQWTILDGNFTRNGSCVHADPRMIAFDAAGRYILVNDGGVYTRTHASADASDGDWVPLSGDLRITEFVGVTYDGVLGVVFGGTQDNGSPFQLSHNSLDDWVEAQAGDGGYTSISYSEAYFQDSWRGKGSFRITLYIYMKAVTVWYCHPMISSDLHCLRLKEWLFFGDATSAPFYAPLQLNVADPSRLLAVYNSKLVDWSLAYSVVENELVVSVQGGEEILAAQQETNPPNFQFNSPGNSILFGHVDDAEFLLASHVQTNSVACSSSWSVVLSKRSSATPGRLQEIFSTCVDPQPLITAALAVHPGHGKSNKLVGVTTKEFIQSVNGGTTWDKWSKDELGFPAQVALLNVAIIPTPRASASDLVVVSTSQGIFVANFPYSKKGSWYKLAGDFPTSLATSLTYDALSDTLLVGTASRGAWLLENASTTELPPKGKPSDSRPRF